MSPPEPRPAVSYPEIRELRAIRGENLQRFFSCFTELLMHQFSAVSICVNP
jgi:hypothetical protein